jgi:hypothetical protein
MKRVLTAAAVADGPELFSARTTKVGESSIDALGGGGAGLAYRGHNMKASRPMHPPAITSATPPVIHFGPGLWLISVHPASARRASQIPLRQNDGENAGQGDRGDDQIERHCPLARFLALVGSLCHGFVFLILAPVPPLFRATRITTAIASR